jgi:hypothetical protein
LVFLKRIEYHVPCPNSGREQFNKKEEAVALEKDK